MAFSPPLPLTTQRQDEMIQLQRGPEDPHLRSANALHAYHIHANDGEIGHLADVLIDDTNWSLRYLVVNTSNWWQGKEVLISPRSTQSIRWTERMVYLGVNRAKVQTSPGYDASQPLPATFDADMAEHYGPPEMPTALLPRA